MNVKCEDSGRHCLSRSLAYLSSVANGEAESTNKHSLSVRAIIAANAKGLKSKMVKGGLKWITQCRIRRRKEREGREAALLCKSDGKNTEGAEVRQGNSPLCKCNFYYFARWARFSAQILNLPADVPVCTTEITKHGNGDVILVEMFRLPAQCQAEWRKI